MNEKTITLTKDSIHALATSESGSGFTRRQFIMMGVGYPPRKGWIKRLVGRKVTDEAYWAVYNAEEARRKKLALRKKKTLA